MACAFLVHPDCCPISSIANLTQLTALDIPFLLLPFRPTSDPSAVRTFVRHFFDKQNGGPAIRGEALQQELRMTEPMVRFPDETTHREIIHADDGGTGYFWCNQVVLEPIARRCCRLGFIRVVQGRRTRFQHGQRLFQDIYPAERRQQGPNRNHLPILRLTLGGCGTW